MLLSIIMQVKELFKFDKHTEQTIKGYLENFSNEVSTMEIRPEYLQTLTFDLEHYLRFFSIKHARRRGSSVVEEVDVNNAIKSLGKPEKFIKSQFKDAATLSRVQDTTLRFLYWMEKKLDDSKNPFVLDAGCGRQVIKLHHH
jgi:hypothetical protein